MRKISFAAGCVGLILNYTKFAFMPMWLILTLILVPFALTGVLYGISLVALAFMGIAQSDIQAPKAVRAFQMKRAQKKMLKRREEQAQRAEQLRERRAEYGRSTQQTETIQRRNAEASR